MERWRDAAYSCYSSGHKFCREVCPVTQVTRNENHSPTAFHANVVAMEKGLLDVGDVAEDYVHCTQCGACELRCPNTLFTGDFYRYRTRTVEVVKAMRALMVETGHEQPEWKRWIERLVDGPQRAGARRDPDRAGARGRLGRRARPAGRRRDRAVRRLRGGVLPDLVRARGRAAAEGGRRRVRADARAVVLRRPGGRDGLRRAGALVRRAQRRRLARGRRQADHRRRPARLHRVHRGLPQVLRRRLRVRDRAGDRPGRRAGARRQAQARAPGGADGHLSRPVPAEQAQGHPRGAARAAARGARPDVRRRRSRHPVVVLLGGGRRTRRSRSRS